MEDKVDTPRPRYLVIVSRDKPDLCRHLVRDFAFMEAVEVVLDRRREERRRWIQAHPEKRRRFDRRFDSSGEINLHRNGFAIVRRQEGGPMTEMTDRMK